jgi:hypothetical protein
MVLLFSEQVPPENMIFEEKCCPQIISEQFANSYFRGLEDEEQGGFIPSSLVLWLVLSANSEYYKTNAK